MKTYYILSIGSSKYVVNYHDGMKSHPDGSPFVDVKICSSRKQLEELKSDLNSGGYVEI